MLKKAFNKQNITDLVNSIKQFIADPKMTLDNLPNVSQERKNAAKTQGNEAIIETLDHLSSNSYFTAEEMETFHTAGLDMSCSTLSSAQNPVDDYTTSTSAENL